MLPTLGPILTVTWPLLALFWDIWDMLDSARNISARIVSVRIVRLHCAIMDLYVCIRHEYISIYQFITIYVEMCSSLNLEFLFLEV